MTVRPRIYAIRIVLRFRTKVRASREICDVFVTAVRCARAHVAQFVALKTQRGANVGLRARVPRRWWPTEFLVLTTLKKLGDHRAKPSQTLAQMLIRYCDRRHDQ